MSRAWVLLARSIRVEAWRPPFHRTQHPRAAPRTAVTGGSLRHQCQAIDGSRTDQLGLRIDAATRGPVRMDLLARPAQKARRGG
jgi:hypothetical protein